LAEEVTEPKKTIPKAVVITIAVAILLYAAVSIVSVGVMGAGGMATSHSPLQQAAMAVKAPGMELVVTMGASTAMLGVLLSQILGISRMLLAMGRRRDMPVVFEKINKRGVPHIGILFTGIIILAVTLLGSFDFVVRAATFTILLYYGITNLSAIKQPAGEHIYGRIIPWLGLAGCIIMSISLPLSVIASGLILLATGFLLRCIPRIN
jgi:APA family basic amino acid/polyamine antiporter